MSYFTQFYDKYSNIQPKDRNEEFQMAIIEALYDICEMIKTIKQK